MKEIKYFSKNLKGFSVDDITVESIKKWPMDNLFFKAEKWQTRFEIITWMNTDKKEYSIAINFWRETIKVIKDKSIVSLREKLKKEMIDLEFDAKDIIEIKDTESNIDLSIWNKKEINKENERLDWENFKIETNIVRNEEKIIELESKAYWLWKIINILKIKKLEEENEN